MLSDLDRRQAVDLENGINSNSTTILSAPFNTLANKKSISIFKVGFYFFVLILLSIISYYSYLLYQQQSKVVSQQATLTTAIVKVKKKVVHPKIIHPEKIDYSRNKARLALATPVLSVPTRNTNTQIIKKDTENLTTLEPANNDITAVKKQQRELSGAQQAELAYQKGYQLLQQNKIYSAEAKLLLALEYNLKHIKAREMLIGLYLKTGRKIEAETLLRKGLLLLPHYSNFTKLYARLLLDNNQIDKAVKTLLNHKPAMTADPNFYALLAASYQRQNNHTAAANTYLKLLKINPRAGIWWVGMGISLEALHKNKEALDAYEKARQTGTLNTRIINYSNQRLKILNAIPQT